MQHYLWNFSGGSPSSSTAKNPIVTYNSAGTYNVLLTATNVYGNDTESKSAYIEVSLPAPKGCGSVTSVTDIEGNIYPTVTIGNQCWIKENLKTSKYADGTSIVNITDNTAWTNTSGGAWCWYKDSAQYEPTYGKLYNWAAASDSRNVCPIGWHVPSKAEWDELIDYVGGKSTAAGHLKETGTAHWNTDSGTDNSSGFTALPGGGRSEFGGGFIYFIGNQGLWWSSTPSSTTNAYQVDIQTNYNYLQYPLLGRGNAAGLSIRCIKD